MNRSRAIILGLSLSTAGLLVACGPATTTPKASGTNAANAAPPPTSVQSQAPSESVPAGAPAAGGTVTTFCHSYGELAKVKQISPSGAPNEADFANVRTALGQAASDMRANAPAEIKSAVDGYSGDLDALAQTLGSSSSIKNYQDTIIGQARNPISIQNLGIVLAWTVKNCTNETLK